MSAPKPESSSPPKRTWRQKAMDSDDGRFWIAFAPAMILAAAVTLPVVIAWNRAHPDGADRTSNAGEALLFLMIYWLFYALIYVLLTLRRFRRLSSGQLHEDLRTVSRGPRARTWAIWSMGTTMTWTAQLAVLALVMVLAVMLIPETRSILAMRILGVLAVAASWVLLVFSQGLAYARANAQEGGVTFAGTPEPEWTDYLSLAIFVSAMIGTGDARLSGRRMRRLMRNHVVVSFGFNSMVIATLATLLIT